jgi:putative membrane protein
VPLLIGINWCLLVIITGTIANYLTSNPFLRVFSSAALMVFLDLFLEHIAPRFDFWTFAGGIAPFKNYLAWFIIAAILQMIFQRFKMQGNFLFSLHLFLAQFLFFFYFFWW